MEYDQKGNIIYEGKYLNGKRFNGKGKELRINGSLKFEGEYFEGEKWNGRGTEYDRDNKLIEVDYCQGSKNEIN